MKCGRQPGQAFASHLDISSQPDPHVLRTLKVASRYHAGFVFLAQERAKAGDVSLPQPGEHRCPNSGNLKLDRGMAAQGRDKRASVGFDEGVGAGGEFFSLLDSDDAEQLANMDFVCREEIVKPPYSRGQFRLGEYPSAAQAA